MTRSIERNTHPLTPAHWAMYGGPLLIVAAASWFLVAADGPEFFPIHRPTFGLLVTPPVDSTPPDVPIETDKETFKDLTHTTPVDGENPEKIPGFTPADVDQAPRLDAANPYDPFEGKDPASFLDPEELFFGDKVATLYVQVSVKEDPSVAVDGEIDFPEDLEDDIKRELESGREVTVLYVSPDTYESVVCNENSCHYFTQAIQQATHTAYMKGEVVVFVYRKDNLIEWGVVKHPSH